MSTSKPHSFRPTITELEKRDVPSVSSLTLTGGILIVKANSSTTTVLVSQSASTITVKDEGANHSWSYSNSKVSEIEVEAGSGADTFTATASNPTTARLVRFIGGSGADDFIGESGPVSMQAGSGSDTLSSVAGNDTLIGGSGTDYLKGGSGNNLIEAGSGNDYLNGGTGVATLVGGIGNDTIIGINGQASDTIETGLGTEVIWVDDINSFTDTIIGSTTGDTVQQVSSFANTGATSVLNGGTFTEPTLLPSTPSNAYEAFTNRPLFAPGGPTIQDVKQYINPAGGGVNATGTNLDDSWLLSALGAIAQEDPAAIEENVVSFGDGTYGVKLGGEFFRVDDKLPVNLAGETFAGYAGLGQDGSIWVPIVEKAFAYYVSSVSAPSYGNLVAADGGTAPLVYAAFGASTSTLGNPALSAFATQADLGSTIGGLLSNGYSTSVNLTTAVAGTSATTGAAVNLVANREYTVMSYNATIFGTVVSVVLRDPSGNNPDGVVVTLANLYAATGTLDFGDVTG